MRMHVAADMLGLLDEVMLLAAGQVLFSGPPQHAHAYFSRMGWPCPPSRAIAEHMLEVRRRTECTACAG